MSLIKLFLAGNTYAIGEFNSDSAKVRDHFLIFNSVAHSISTVETYINGRYSLKILSSEMDPAKIRLIL